VGQVGGDEAIGMIGRVTERFGKPADTIVHEDEPFNAEPPRGVLGREAITPFERLYVRGHGAVPELPPGEHQILVRAWDTSGGTQPESPATVWNPKGYMNTAWGRMRITVDGKR
jgi:hypothetical protein